MITVYLVGKHKCWRHVQCPHTTSDVAQVLHPPHHNSSTLVLVLESRVQCLSVESDSQHFCSEPTDLRVNCSTMTVAPGPVRRWSPGKKKKKKTADNVLVLFNHWQHKQQNNKQTLKTLFLTTLLLFLVCEKCALLQESNCQECELCNYYQSVRRFLLLLVLLRGSGGCRLSWLSWCIRLSGRRARGRRIHKDFISHSEANLLPLVHVQVVRALVCLILPNPDLFRFITAAVAKDGIGTVKPANDSKLDVRLSSSKAF